MVYNILISNEEADGENEMNETVTIKLGTFETAKGEKRIYVNGTTREKIYYTGGEGYLKSSVLPGFYLNSDALRVQHNTSSVSTRRNKDIDAFNEASKYIKATYGAEISFEALYAELSK